MGEPTAAADALCPLDHENCGGCSCDCHGSTVARATAIPCIRFDKDACPYGPHPECVLAAALSNREQLIQVAAAHVTALNSAEKQTRCPHYERRTFAYDCSSCVAAAVVDALTNHITGGTDA